jgi:aryl-alcohol dehydrogenase-like predicted oxidoreductase
MEFRRLGESGLVVSVVGLGTNNLGMKLDDAQSREVVHAALDEGITLFDTADSYGESERRLGELLEGARADVVIATKFGGDVRPRGNDNGADWGARGSRRYVRRAVESSLRRLRTDWIDLYQIHQPDPRTPIEETLRALDDLIHQGKVRYVGCSNFPAWQVMDAHWTAKSDGLNGFVSCQDEYSLVFRKPEAELMPAMRKLGLGLLPFFPLASGLLTGKYRRNSVLPEGTRLANAQRLADRYLTDRNWEIAERLGDFAASRGHTMLELAFSWLLSRDPVASVIAGATKPQQLEQNVTAGNWQLSAEDVAAIDAIAGGPDTATV